MKVNLLVKSDLFRYTGDTSFPNFFYHFIMNPGFRYSYFMRKCHYYQEEKFVVRKLIFYIFLHYHSIKYSVHIPPSTKIGHGLYLGYGENITINGLSVIGNNVNINHGAVIGKTNRGKKMGAPVIGDCVWIGTNAVIVGNITIDNDVLIAPLSYVNFDVPANAVVAGNPAKIISYLGSEGYVTKKWIHESDTSSENNDDNIEEQVTD